MNRLVYQILRLMFNELLALKHTVYAKSPLVPVGERQALSSLLDVADKETSHEEEDDVATVVRRRSKESGKKE